MNLNLFKPQNDEEKKKINSVKKIYYDFFKEPFIWILFFIFGNFFQNRKDS